MTALAPSRATGCKCEGTGRLGGDQVHGCPCLDEDVYDELDRVTAERDRLFDRLERELALRVGAEEAASRAISRASDAAAAERARLRIRLAQRMADLAAAQNVLGAKAMKELWEELCLESLGEVARG